MQKVKLLKSFENHLQNHIEFCKGTATDLRRIISNTSRKAIIKSFSMQMADCKDRF